MTLRAALAVSILIHSFIVAPFSGFQRRDSTPREKPAVVDYIVIKERVDSKLEKASLNRVKHTRLEIAKKVDIKPADSAANVKSPAIVSRQNAEEALRRETHIKSTKDYINYYQLIREKIRRTLKDHYRNYHDEGNVSLAFVLNAAGSVESVSVEPSNTTANKVLQDIAVTSVAEASPYPAFPRAINLPRISFSVQISFQKE